MCTAVNEFLVKLPARPLKRESSGSVRRRACDRAAGVIVRQYLLVDRYYLVRFARARRCLVLFALIRTSFICNVTHRRSHEGKINLRPAVHGSARGIRGPGYDNPV